MASPSEVERLCEKYIYLPYREVEASHVPYIEYDELLGAAMEGLVKAATKWRGQPHEDVKFYWWAKTIIQRTIVDRAREEYGRRYDRKRPLSIDGFVEQMEEEHMGAITPHALQVEDDVDFTLGMESFKEEIKGLPQQWKRVLFLRFYCDMTAEQTAEALGISVTRVGKIFYMAIRRIAGIR